MINVTWVVADYFHINNKELFRNVEFYVQNFLFVVFSSVSFNLSSRHGPSSN